MLQPTNWGGHEVRRASPAGWHTDRDDAGGWTFAGQVDGLDTGDPEQFSYTDR